MKSRRSLLKDATRKPRRVLPPRTHMDEFGEVGPRKRAAEAVTRSEGHQLRGWHKRPNDPAGRWNNYCTDCNRAVIVCTEAPEGFPDMYGEALTENCREAKK